jgi:hypothetical protein
LISVNSGCGDLAVVLGGFNPALPATACYSEAHYNSVIQNQELARLAHYDTLFVDSLTAPVRAFVCTNPNAWNYPAKDRSGRLEQFEPPHLGALIAKLTGPGQRKPFTVSTGQDAQAEEGV